MGIFTAETIYGHMNTAHGTIHDDVPVIPEPPVYIGIQVDMEQQRELLRQAEMRRVAALRNANVARAAQGQDHDDVWHWGAANRVDLARQAMERQREAEERMERIRRQREVEERERRLRERRLLLEADERRRAQERQSGGWNCTIM